MDAFNGTDVEFDTLFSSESILARLYYVIHTDPTEKLDIDLTKVEARIVEASRTWEDNLSEALADQFGEELGNTYANEYQDAFPEGYKEHFSPRTACFDI